MLSISFKLFLIPLALDSLHSLLLDLITMKGGVSAVKCCLFLGCSGIHLAAQFGHTAIVAYFIAKGQDVDMRDKNGMTPLMWSAFRVFG